MEYCWSFTAAQIIVCISLLTSPTCTDSHDIVTDVCDIQDGPEAECAAFITDVDEDGWKMPDNHSYYQIRSIKVGVEIRGISLQEDPPQHVIDQMKLDIFRYSILVIFLYTDNL